MEENTLHKKKQDSKKHDNFWCDANEDKIK